MSERAAAAIGVRVGVLAALVVASTATAQLVEPRRVGPYGPPAPAATPPAVPLDFHAVADTLGDVDPWAMVVSRDGQVVAGVWNELDARLAYQETVVYTPGSGLRVIGKLPGHVYSAPKGMSADGAVVVGSSTEQSYLPHAFRWSAATGLQSLGVLPGHGDSDGRAVSGDGAVVFGTCRRIRNGGWVGDDAFRWTAAHGMQEVSAGEWSDSGFIPSVSNYDGSVAAGTHVETFTDFPGERSDALVWTAGPAGHEVSAGTVEQLPSLPTTDLGSSRPLAMNDAGTVIVGTCGTVAYSKNVAAIWRRDGATGEWSVESLGGADRQIAPSAVSANGGVVVGYGRRPLNISVEPTAVVWTVQRGWDDLNVLLPQMGVDLDGWYLTEASSVSPDGTRISGFGHGPNGARVWTVSGLTLTTAP